jgi:hypothetical protein
MGDPGSQHPYMYCRGNPINNCDHSGLDFSQTHENNKIVMRARMAFIMNDGVNQNIITNWISELIKYYKDSGVKLIVYAYFTQDQKAKIDPKYTAFNVFSGKGRATGGTLYSDMPFEHFLHEVVHRYGLYHDEKYNDPTWKSLLVDKGWKFLHADKDVMITAAPGSRISGPDWLEILFTTPFSTSEQKDFYNGGFNNENCKKITE